MSQSLHVLSKNDRKKLFAIIIVQILLGFLDLVGVLLIGALGALSIQGIESHQAGNKVSALLRLFGIQNLSFQNEVAILGITASGCLILKTASSIFFTRKTLRFLSHKNTSLSNDLIEKVLSQDLLDMQKRPTQEILYILSDGVHNLFFGIIGSAVTVASDIIMLLIMCAGLYVVDPVIAFSTTILFLIIGLVLYKQLQVKAKMLGSRLNRLSVQSYRKTFEVLNSYRESVVRHRRKYYAEQIGKIRYQLGDVIAEQSFLPYISKYVIEAATVLSVLILAGYEFGTKSAVHAVATLAVFMAASSRIAPAALRIQQGTLMMKTSSGSAESTLILFNELKKYPLSQAPVNITDFVYIDFTPQIIASELEFRYPNEAKFTLEKVSFEIKPSTITAIVGPSGAGKTTLIDLLLGVLNPASGSILISGVSPAAASEKWPGAISYVPQNIHIISGTVKENVIMGYDSDAATDELVWRALDLAQLGDTIRNLPKGLNTEVGEAGGLMSGGQRQRLGIARALFSAPKLLVLDEATSALDGATEFEITKSLQNLSREVTVLVVAHRLSTVREAENVLYFAEGRLVAQGKFEDVREQVPNFNHQADLMGL